MNAPLLSNISLITEFFVTGVVFYIFYRGYKKNVFHTKLAIVTMLYELIFNISYMASRTSHATSKSVGPVVLLAVVHGILSLVMFVLLIIFLIVAWTRYRKGENFFHNHKILTFTFLFFWSISVLSGFGFYIFKYILHL
jgi:hypothetical protein